MLGSTPAELPLPEGIQVVFNHRDLARYRSPLTDQWRNGDNLEEFIVKAINEAQQEIFVAVQELSLPVIAQALVAAKQRGVNVRIVMENTYSQPWGDLHEAGLSLRERRHLAQLKILADRNSDGNLSLQERQHGDAVEILRRNKIPLIDDREDGSKGSGLMHHKFLVIDGLSVITGSANFSSSGIHGDAGAWQTRGNVNHLLRF
ncbi:MAG: phospholipase D-like domain-containing protein, partial [Prochlorococcus sp.]